MSDQPVALVVAGGAWQVPIVSYLQGLGYRVCVVDPYPTSPAVLIADEHIEADVRDSDAILNRVSERTFHLVTTDQSDISVKTVSLLAQALGLSGNKPEVVDLFTNKYLSRQYASGLGIPIPAYRKAVSVKDISKAIEDLGLPVIIKPVDSQSSRGIVKIDETNIDKLTEAVAFTFGATNEDYILVEAFFEGIELTAEGICSGGKHQTIAISQKKHFRTGIASELEYPARIPEEAETALKQFNDSYVEHSGLQTAITHAEYLYNPETGKLCLVEIACRGGGTLISSDIAKWVSGVDLYKILVDGLNSIVTDVKALTPLRRNAVLHFFEFPNGIVTKIEGLGEIRSTEGVKYLKLDFREGDEIRSASDDRSRQGFVIIFADSKAELDNRLNLVSSVLQVSLRSSNTDENF